ncbi:hypothetical protein GCM10007384_33260 [Aquimarina muelleri]|uniref:Uncharacterized protein n=1 Tax=Aquimarina muelleri TaxID=279356 RepID=A0A918JYX2_9FLAO|nr:hypothetical protein GCM10007384_33260 [Aquimarina muelleri]
MFSENRVLSPAKATYFCTIKLKIQAKQENTNYNRTDEAIDYIKANFKEWS